MSLRKPWRDLDRTTLAGAPDAPGVYELGDADGEPLRIDSGIVRDELKEVLAYGSGEATQVRWTVAQSPDHADRLLAEHVGE
ncbi:DUF7508 domain-containing protein [Haloparvum sedimenti]|uniref:DUF7508 domain-containing protein n=1 Tax=Haloparvum sedimenti TaxID=1678448 RepID=UPI00071E7CC5|nr:hypothetical protein [Haloparvum sedimenti]